MSFVVHATLFPHFGLCAKMREKKFRYQLSKICSNILLVRSFMYEFHLSLFLNPYRKFMYNCEFRTGVILINMNLN